MAALLKHKTAPSKQLVSWPSSQYNSSQPIRLCCHENPAPTPAVLELAYTFKPFKTACPIEIPRNQEMGISRGSENVTIGSVEEAKSAIVGLDDDSQWLWCGNMGRNLDMSHGRGFLRVPLLGGAFCACTWHFYYNSESLEVLVALQAALTVIGNATMCYAAFRICKASEERSQNNL